MNQTNKLAVFPEELIIAVGNWLGDEGAKFFQGILDEHGELNAVFMKDGFPHAVHFREGMQVRNFIRGTGLLPEDDAIDLDGEWETIVRLALRERNRCQDV